MPIFIHESGRVPEKLHLRLCRAVMGIATVAALTLSAADVPRVLQIQQAQLATGPWVGVGEVSVNLPGTSGQGYYRLAWDGSGTSSVPASYAWIPGGGFSMGTPDSEVQRRTAEGPQTAVRISQGFWMSRLETTQREWAEVMVPNDSSAVGPDLPVDSVGWDDAVEYCSRLTLREREAGRLPSGYVYRLPTEAEWEYACRAGSTNATFFGDSLSSTNANFDGSQPYGSAAVGPNIGRTVRGGQYPPNAWGLHDMHGNVWEWCGDWHPSKLPGGWVTDPVGAGSVRQRALRGGAWHNEGAMCRSGYRYLIGPIFRAFSSGLRPVVARQLYP